MDGQTDGAVQGPSSGNHGSNGRSPNPLWRLFDSRGGGLGGAGVAARAVSGNSIRLFRVHLSWGQGSSSGPNPGTRTWLSQLISSQVLDPDPILASSSVLQSPRVHPSFQDVQQVWEHPEQPLPRSPPKRTGQGLEPGSCGEFQVGFWPCKSIISAGSWLLSWLFSGS